jgi:hypothetical protein
MRAQQTKAATTGRRLGHAGEGRMRKKVRILQLKLNKYLKAAGEGV